MESEKNRKVKVVFFQRKPYDFHKSIESVFEDVRARMPAWIVPVQRVMAHYSKGIGQRIKIVWEAYRHQGDINHITGDIHFAAILLNRKKTILTIHDCGMLAASSGLKHALLKFFWFTWPLKRCTYVTVVSEATKNALLSYTRYPEHKIHVIPVAVSEGFTYVPKTFNPNKPIILHIGTKPNKNLERLVAALQGISAELRIIGRLPENLLAQIKHSGINFVNRYDLCEREIIEEYRNCDFLAFVSTYEGFGMPIVEANLTGRPVLTSNISSMPEVANGAACMVDPYHVAEIRNGIQKIIADEEYRKELILKGLENAKRFNAQHIAEQYLHLYEKLMSSS